MKRFNRLRKTAKSLAKQHNHTLGVFYKTSDLTYQAKCIDCGLHCSIHDNPNIKINSGEPFNDPRDLTPMYASKMNNIFRKELQIELYGPKQSGYIIGPVLMCFCKQNPFIVEVPSLP